MNGTVPFPTSSCYGFGIGIHNIVLCTVTHLAPCIRRGIDAPQFHPNPLDESGVLRGMVVVVACMIVPLATHAFAPSDGSGVAPMVAHFLCLWMHRSS